MIWPWPRRRTAVVINKINDGKTPPGRGRGGQGGQGGGHATGQATNVSVVKSTTQAISPTAAAISWDAVVQDDGNIWSAGQPTRLTARSDGWYIVQGSILWAVAPSSHKRMQFRKNGTTTYPGVEGYPSTTQRNKNSALVILYLEKNDYVEIMARQSVAGTINVDSGNAALVKVSSGSGCQVHLTANEGVANTGTTAIPWDAEDRDDGGYWDAGAPTRLTVASNGWYLICVNFIWNSVSGDHWAGVEFRKNGATTYVGHIVIDGSGVDYDFGASILLQLSATDYIEALASQTSGTNPQNIASGGFAAIAKVG